jgi:hypothetical protein
MMCKMMCKLRVTLTAAAAILMLAIGSIRLPADSGSCGGATFALPFTDVAGNPFFCQIAEAFFSGLTNGTTPTTYSPSADVPREQMAAFITRTQDAAIRRGSLRGAVNEWSLPNVVPTNATTVGIPQLVVPDGADLWVADFGGSTVKRVRASDGRALESWSGVSRPFGVLVARGLIYVTDNENPGHLCLIDPRLPPGVVATLSSSLGPFPEGVSTDGVSIWTANEGSISKVDPDTGVTTNITAGFSRPKGILFDGGNLWVSDFGDSKLKKIDSSGSILQSVTVGSGPAFPVFEGSNIWVPSADARLTVVRARDGVVLATLTGNGLNGPVQAAFDGERILVTNQNGMSVSLWKASDLIPIGSSVAAPPGLPVGACSDGVNFWITVVNEGLVRF